MRSRLNRASFSIRCWSCSSTGPAGPAVWLFWLSATGAPDSAVRVLAAWRSAVWLSGVGVPAVWVSGVGVPAVWVWAVVSAVWLIVFSSG